MTEPVVLTDEEQTGRNIAALQNALMICPTPHRVSCGSLTRATALAARRTTKTGVTWEPYKCVCRRFHCQVVLDV